MRNLFSSNWLKVVGGIAQLVERLHGMQEVSGSIPLTSTNLLHRFNELSHIALWLFLLDLRWCQIGVKLRRVSSILTQVLSV